MNFVLVGCMILDNYFICVNLKGIGLFLKVVGDGLFWSYFLSENVLRILFKILYFNVEIVLWYFIK